MVVISLHNRLKDIYSLINNLIFIENFSMDYPLEAFPLASKKIETIMDVSNCI